MTNQVITTIFFTDTTQMTLGWPPQAGSDTATILMNVRKALEQDKLAVEVDGDLLIIPMQNVKYIHITPAPAELPKNVLTKAHIIS